MKSVPFLCYLWKFCKCEALIELTFFSCHEIRRLLIYKSELINLVQFLQNRWCLWKLQISQPNVMHLPCPWQYTDKNVFQITALVNTYFLTVRPSKSLGLFYYGRTFFREAWNGVVVKALRYLSDGPGIDSRWCLDFSGTYSFRPYHGPGVDSAPSENEYQEYFLGLRAGGAWGWQPHHLHVLNVMEIWEAKHPGTLWATQDLFREILYLLHSSASTAFCRHLQNLISRRSFSVSSLLVYIYVKVTSTCFGWYIPREWSLLELPDELKRF